MRNAAQSRGGRSRGGQRRGEGPIHGIGRGDDAATDADGEELAGAEANGEERAEGGGGVAKGEGRRDGDRDRGWITGDRASGARDFDDVTPGIGRLER